MVLRCLADGVPLDAMLRSHLAPFAAALLATFAPSVNGQGGQAITRLRITPAVRSVAVGDSLRLRVEALDARGSGSGRYDPVHGAGRSVPGFD